VPAGAWSNRRASPDSGDWTPPPAYTARIDDLHAVLAANRAYYDAFEGGDLDAMSDVWEHSDRVVCTHPGWASLRGWASVAASFFAIFQGGAGMQFILTGEHAEVEGDLAWVAVDENLLGTQVGGTVAALNLFVRHATGWRMVAHHASAVSGSDPDDG
jgi:ketosteroid isomerase-like protein